MAGDAGWGRWWGCSNSSPALALHPDSPVLPGKSCYLDLTLVRILLHQVSQLLQLLNDPASAPLTRTLPYETNGYKFDPARLPAHMRGSYS